MGQLALPILGIALSAGGSALNGIQQQQYQAALAQSEQDAYRASKAAREAEQGRQGQFNAEAQAQLAKTQQAISPDADAADRSAADEAFMSLYNQRGTTQPEGQYLSGQENASELVKSEIAKRAAVASQDARARVAALSKVMSFDQAMNDNALALGQGADFQNQLGGIRRGSLSVGQQEAGIAPQQVYPGNNLLGPLMQAAGGITSGLSGVPGGFGGFNVNSSTGVSTSNWNPMTLFTGAPKPATGGWGFQLPWNAK